MEFFLIFMFITLIFGALTYFMSSGPLKRIKTRDESFLATTIKNLLSVLSKCWFCLLGVLMIVAFMHFTNVVVIRKMIIPAQVMLYWYIILRLEPAAFHDIANITGDCGLKNTQYSRTLDRKKENYYLVIGSLIIFYSLILSVYIPYLRGTTLYSAQISEICQNGIVLARIEDPNSLSLNYLLAASVTNSMTVSLFALFGVAVCFINIVLSLKKFLIFVYENNGKTQANLQILYVLLRKVYVNILLLCGLLLTVVYQSGVYKGTRILIENDVAELGLLGENCAKLNDYIVATSVKYWSHLSNDLLIQVINIIMFLGTILLTLNIYLICNKLFVLYKYKDEIDKLPPDLKDDLSEFQSYLLRIVFNPKGLDKKKSTKESLIEYVKRIKTEAPDVNLWIFLLGTPLAITTSEIISIQCRKVFKKLEV